MLRIQLSRVDLFFLAAVSAAVVTDCLFQLMLAMSRFSSCCCLTCCCCYYYIYCLPVIIKLGVSTRKQYLICKVSYTYASVHTFFSMYQWYVYNKTVTMVVSTPVTTRKRSNRTAMVNRGKFWSPRVQEKGDANSTVLNFCIQIGGCIP